MWWGGRWCGVILVAACACVQLRDYEPPPLPPGCTLPAGDGPRIRIANLVAAEGSVDVCIAPAGGRMRAVYASSGRDCPRGLSYGDVSQPFVPGARTIDVRIVEGGTSCASKPLAELNALSLASPQTTLAYLGGGTAERRLTPFAEAPIPIPSGRVEVRIIHALSGIPSLDIGFTNTPRLPTELNTRFLQQPLGFGEATTGVTQVTIGNAVAAGYIALPVIVLHIAAAEAGSKRALLVTTVGESDGRRRTVFTVGLPKSAVYPVRALVCDDDELDGIRTRCQWSVLPTLSVDIFNAQLYGPYAADEALRRPAILEALARRDSDLMCLTAISRKTDHEAIAAATRASGSFPHAVAFDADLDTQPSHPADRDREQSQRFAYPPCAGTVTPAEGDAALSCLRGSCSTTGTDAGVLSGGSDCMSGMCTGEFVPLLVGDRDHHRCFHCIVLSALSGETHGATRAHCQVDKRNYKHFAGQSRSMLLSRFPLQEPRTYVLPATSYTILVHSARAEIEPGRLLDVYCAELSAAFGDLLPYYGYYADLTKADGWAQEQLLQAERVVALVRAQSGARPAIVAGDWAASRAYESPDKKIVIDDQNGAVFDVLEGAFKLAVPKGFLPRCTECPPPENPYNGTKSIWQMKVYLYNMPAEAAVDAQRFFTDFVVPLPTGSKAPLSDRFGFSVRILRP